MIFTSKPNLKAPVIINSGNQTISITRPSATVTTQDSGTQIINDIERIQKEMAEYEEEDVIQEAKFARQLGLDAFNAIKAVISNDWATYSIKDDKDVVHITHLDCRNTSIINSMTKENILSLQELTLALQQLTLKNEDLSSKVEELTSDVKTLESRVTDLESEIEDVRSLTAS